MDRLPRAFELDEILTPEEIANAHRLFKRGKKKFYAAALAQIVEPAWDRIVNVLGPCSKMYVTYGIEYRCLKKRKPTKRRTHTEKFVDGLMTLTGRRRSRNRPEDKAWNPENIYHADTTVDIGLSPGVSG